MTLPLYYKAGRRWSQLCPRTLCHRGIALGILSILVIGMLCTTLLVGMWTEVEETALEKRGLENGETPKDELEKSGYERDLRHLQPLDRYQPTITSASTNGGSLAGGALQLPVDLLGGLTGVMSNFHVGQTTMTPSPTAGAVDPLAALSVAFQQAIANGELLHNEVNIERRGPEARGNNGYIQDSVIWAGQPSLVN
ncbi:WSC domain-containing [Cordyceps militaris]|uniref:WSC domain-containing n=1 Tax=Cordyceps militaris TaxID=73501 RepID=A0A2H4SK63_CORMI|nr:WSC domain-containing [Cordyceps militaris]